MSKFYFFKFSSQDCCHKFFCVYSDFFNTIFFIAHIFSKQNSYLMFFSSSITLFCWTNFLINKFFHKEVNFIKKKFHYKLFLYFCHHTIFFPPFPFSPYSLLPLFPYSQFPRSPGLEPPSEWRNEWVSQYPVPKDTCL